MNIVCDSNPQRLLLLFISATIPAMYLTRTRNKKHIQRNNDDSFISTKISQNYPKLVANYRDIFSLTYNLAIIYMLIQRFKIELCRPVGACIMSDSPIRRVSPYADLCRPFPTSRDKSRLAFDNEFGSTCISLPIISV